MSAPLTFGAALKPNAIIIGSRPASSRFPTEMRRPTAPPARQNARLPVPRRIPHEFYPTPPAAVRALLSVEQFDGSIWEPACGQGAIAAVLADADCQVVSTDLHGYGFGTSGVDFLTEPVARARHIVTNPPYGSGLADAFVLKALALTKATGGKVAMLLNLASLCHPTRTGFWQTNPPARIFAVDGHRIFTVRRLPRSGVIAIAG